MTWQDAFAQARTLTTWHYQWLLVIESLPLFVGPAMVDDAFTNGRRFYTAGASTPSGARAARIAPVRSCRRSFADAMGV